MDPSQIDALKIASQIKHPFALAALSLVLSAFIFYGIKGIRANRWPAFLLAAMIGFTGCVPAIVRSVAEFRGVYHLRVIVLGSDRLPATNAHVTLSVGGEAKQISGGWEFDIPPQTKPADGLVSIYASIDSEFLTGSATAKLGDSYYPVIAIQLAADTSAKLQGIVIDRHRHAVPGARVSIVGRDEAVTTNEIGAFTLDAHAAVGQVVRVRAEKGLAVQEISAVAGKAPVEIELPVLK
jgi:hypothetical protein